MRWFYTNKVNIKEVSLQLTASVTQVSVRLDAFTLSTSTEKGGILINI